MKDKNIKETTMPQTLPELRPKQIDFEKTVGSTTYAVTSSFNKDAGEDIFNKVRRRILSD